MFCVRGLCKRRRWSDPCSAGFYAFSRDGWLLLLDAEFSAAVIYPEQANGAYTLRESFSAQLIPGCAQSIVAPFTIHTAEDVHRTFSEITFQMTFGVLESKKGELHLLPVDDEQFFPLLFPFDAIGEE